MRIAYITFLLLFCQLFSYGQFSSYERQIEKAQMAYDNKNFELSLAEYDSAFLIINFIPYDYFEAFKGAINQGDFSKATNLLKRGTLKGLDISQWTAEELTIYLNSDQSSEYKTIKDSLLKEHFRNIDTITYKRLVFLKNKDQKKRNNDQFSVYSDSLNFDELINITKHRGFPTFNNTGYGQSIAFLLLWHHRDEYPSSKQWREIIPFIENEIRNGNITPRFLEPMNQYQSNRRERK